LREPALFPVDRTGSSLPSGSSKLLVVEDEYLVAMDIEATLRDAGFTVVGIAVSAEEAVALARAHGPDLVIMDIRLAGPRDGVDAALELFRESGVRCIFATAHSDVTTRLRAEPALPLGWLAKPYQPQLLVRAVRNALDELHPG
jgi:DNA-binding NarL/FixJ family response regulator